MFPDNLTRAETRARAELIRTHAYAIEIDLSGRHVEDPERLFRSDTTITFDATADGDVHVDLIADRVESASLDGTDLDPGDVRRLPAPAAADCRSAHGPGDRALPLQPDR